MSDQKRGRNAGMKRGKEALVAGSRNPPGPAADSAEAARQVERLEPYFDRLLAKCEAAKADLERNWALQVGSIAACVAVIVGLGGPIADSIMDGLGRNYRLLYVVCPIVNTYLFVRFGGLATAFSTARHNAGQIGREIAATCPPPSPAKTELVYQTNSHFEYVHHDFSRAKFAFSLSIPLIFALNHSTTIFLLIEAAGLNLFSALILSIYLVIVLACYVTYFIANRDNTPLLGPAYVAAAAFLLTLALLAAAWRLPHDLWWIEAPPPQGK